MSNHRKELSIPRSVVVTQEVLFDKESLGLAQAQSKINRAFFPRGMMADGPSFFPKNHYPSFFLRQILRQGEFLKGSIWIQGIWPLLQWQRARCPIICRARCSNILFHRWKHRLLWWIQKPRRQELWPRQRPGYVSPTRRKFLFLILSG